jgi:isoquinoline 1-oxidoreductase beta subunit
VIVGEYYLPHLAHVSMEPPVAVADVKGDKAEIWAPVQSSGGTREDVAKTLRHPRGERHRQRHPARRHAAQIEMRFRSTALLSKELGAPVKGAWTREDDTRLPAPSRPNASGPQQDGKVIAWRHRSVAPTIPRPLRRCRIAGAVRRLGMGLVDMPSDRQRAVRKSGSGCHTRIGWFRSVSTFRVRSRCSPHGR